MTNTEPTTAILSADDTDTAVTQYLVTALWPSIGDDDEPLDQDHDLTDVSDDLTVAARADVVAFVELAGRADVRAYLAAFGGDAGQLGHDLWLTRNGHGVGFWDRGLGALGDRLTAHAQSFGEIHLYVGDDGLIYGE
jgi:hypothetical protein